MKIISRILLLAGIILFWWSTSQAVIINSGETFLNNPAVQLTLNLPTNCYQVQVQNESNTPIVSAPAATMSWNLSPGDGLKKVNVVYSYYSYYYYQCNPYSCNPYCCSHDWLGRCTGTCYNICYNTCQGQTSNTVSESAQTTLDQTPPSLTISTPTDNSHTTNQTLSVAGTTSDLNGIKDLLVGVTSLGGSSGGFLRTFGTTVQLNPGGNAITVVSKDNAGNSNTISRIVYYDMTVSVSTTGSGAGSVTSSPAGIDCGATCSASFPFGSPVVLFQNPGSSSGFSGWGVACSGTGNCAFSMSSDKSVTASFIQSPLVKNQRTGVGYSLLQTAHTEALNGDSIMALHTLPAATLMLDAVKNLTIEGGYAPDYATSTGLTSIFGPLTVKAMTRVNGLAIRPAASSAKAITAFGFTTPAAVGVVTEATHSIVISVPSGTNVTALVPTITHTGASISPASGTPQNFTNPVVYTVTAQDSTTQAYTVTVQFVAPYILPTTATDVSLGANSVLVDGTRAYIIEGTAFKVLDVSNPLSPVLIGSVIHGFTDLRVEAHAIYNNIVWCVRSSSGGYGAATYVFGIDVSDPLNPVVRGTLTLQTGTSLLANVSLIYAGYLLVHDYSRNLIYVINISNPLAPAVYSSWSVPNMVNGGPGVMMIDGTLLYLPCRENFTFRIYNIANLTAVTQVGSVPLPADSSGPPVKIGSYVYISDSSGLRVIDVSTPATPSIVGTLAVSSGYLKSRNGKLFSFDISTPTVRAYSLANPVAPTLETSSIVVVPAPSTSLTLSPLSFPAAAWVGNYLIGMTYGSAAQYNGARALNFPVN